MSAKTTAVFLHGFSGEGHSLQPFAEAHSGSSALCVDLLGFGAAPNPSPLALKDFDAYCEEMWRYITEQTSPESKVVLVGHSYGAMVAFSIAAQHPERVERLDLYCPVATPRRAPRLVGDAIAWSQRLRIPPTAIVKIFSNRLAVDAVTMTMVRREWSRQQRAKIYAMRRHEAKLYSPKMASVTRHSLSFASSMDQWRAKVPTRICFASDDTVAGPNDAQWYVDRTEIIDAIETTGGHLAVVAEAQRLGRIFEAKINGKSVL